MPLFLLQDVSPQAVARLARDPQGLGEKPPTHPPGSLEGRGGHSGGRSYLSRGVCPRCPAAPSARWQWVCPTLPRPHSSQCAVVSGVEGGESVPRACSGPAFRKDLPAPPASPASLMASKVLLDGHKARNLPGTA